jgi:hypothetical protein
MNARELTIKLHEEIESLSAEAIDVLKTFRGQCGGDSVMIGYRQKLEQLQAHIQEILELK